jgi:hypothetical protein
MPTPKRGDAHIKRGTIREDGKYFWGYKKEKEIWLTKEQYEKWDDTRKDYVRRCRNRYYERQAAKHIIDRNYIGKYDSSKNLYFLKISTAGKEIWGTKHQLEAFSKQHTIYRRRMYYKLLEQHPVTGLKIGDKNPDNPNEYVVFFIGNKPYFGSKHHLKERQKSRAISYRKRTQKYKLQREAKLRSIEKRIKRGTENPETGLVFYCYAQNGNERWITKEYYQKILEQERIKKKRHSQEKRRHRQQAYINSCKVSENTLS